MHYLLIKVHEICENSTRVQNSQVNIQIGDDTIYEMSYVAPQSDIDAYGEDIDVVPTSMRQNQVIELRFMDISAEFKMQLEEIKGNDFRVFEQAGLGGRYRVCLEVFSDEFIDCSDENRYDMGKDMWKVIGHRGFGANKLMPTTAFQVEENTALSISSAFRFGIRAVEVDVQRLIDGSLVLYHDEDLSVHGVHIPLCALDQQQFLTLSREFNKSEIPIIEDRAITLSSALMLITSDCGINIELKMYREKRPEPRLREMYEYCRSVHQQVVNSKTLNVIFSSFDITLCILMQLVQAAFPVFFIIPEFGTSYEKVEKCLYKHKLRGVVMTANQALYFGENLKRIKRMGVYCFTYQQPESIKLVTKQFEYGVDGVIIDDPRRYQWLLP